MILLDVSRFARGNSNAESVADCAVVLEFSIERRDRLDAEQHSLSVSLPEEALRFRDRSVGPGLLELLINRRNTHRAAVSNCARQEPDSVVFPCGIPACISKKYANIFALFAQIRRRAAARGGLALPALSKGLSACTRTIGAKRCPVTQ